MSGFHLSLSQTGAVDPTEFVASGSYRRQTNTEGILKIGTPPRTYLISWTSGKRARFSVRRNADDTSAVGRFVNALMDLFARRSLETRASRIERNFNRIGAVTTSAILDGIASHRVRGGSDREIAAVHELRDMPGPEEVVDKNDVVRINHNFVPFGEAEMARFRAKYLPDMDFSRLCLEEHDFYGANLRRARFRDADLTDANFSGADLRGASFRGADLSGANFSGADLRGANFLGASLLGADLSGARLKDAKIERHQLLQASMRRY